MKIKFKYQEVVGWAEPAKLYYGFFTKNQKNRIETSILSCDTIMYNKRKTNTEHNKNEPKNKYYIQLITSDYELFEEAIALIDKPEYELDRYEHAYLI